MMSSGIEMICDFRPVSG